MSVKKCPSGKTLVRSFKNKSGKKTRSFCRSKPKYKTSRKKISRKVVKKSSKSKSSKSKSSKSSKSKSSKSSKSKSSKSIKPVVVEERKLSRPRSPKSRKPSRKSVKEQLRFLKQRLAEITGVKTLTDNDIREILHQYGNNMKNCIKGDFELKSYIGSGENGSVFLICKKGTTDEEEGNCRIIKIQEIIDNYLIQNEIDMQNIFYNYNLAPKIHNVCKFNKGKRRYLIIEMDPIVGTLETLLLKQSDENFLRTIIAWIIDVMEKLCKNKLTHGDFHWRNIGYNINKDNGDLEPVLIDFSWSSNKVCNPRLEVIQLLRTISLAKMNKFNEKYLEDNIYEIYTTEFNKNLAKNIKAYDKEYNKLMDEYEKKI